MIILLFYVTVFVHNAKLHSI